MFPYRTRSSVVGVNSGTESGMMRDNWNFERTSAARAAEMPDAGHVCLLASKGDARVGTANRENNEIFIVMVRVMLIMKI
jgi:hypothetical protein